MILLCEPHLQYADTFADMPFSRILVSFGAVLLFYFFIIIFSYVVCI